MEPKRPIPDLDWALTPPAAKQYIQDLELLISALGTKIDRLENRTEKLETQTKKNSQNSRKPPSSDSPYKKPIKKGLPKNLWVI